MKLPNDIARCHNALCPFRENCLRWINRGSGRIHDYLIPDPDGCRHMLRKPEEPKEPVLKRIVP